METKALRFLATGVFLFASVAACAQLTVDATVPIRRLRWDTHGGTGGSIGARLPVLVTVERTGATERQSGPTRVEFTLTNTGKADLQIPISPQPADLEPKDPHTVYTVTSLSLYIGNASGPPVLKGGAILYGKPDAPGTMVGLLPGQSMRVLAIVWFPDTRETSATFRAIVSKECTTFRMGEGRTVSDSHEIGSAFSNDFTLSSLSSVPIPGTLPR